MTATRDRRSDLDDSPAAPAWDERPILGRSRGLPWWGAILLAWGLTAVAAVIDMQAQGTLGKIFQATYVISCVAAICLVRRANLFGPMVQPPLVFAIVAVVANLALAPTDAGGGKRTLLITIGFPLTSNFPTMAITTGITLGLGILRLFMQRDPDRVSGSRSGSSSRSGSGSGSGESARAKASAASARPKSTRERPSAERGSTRTTDRKPPRKPRDREDRA
ncbi:DUF6542 domain-containing protein [Actinokineospora globicatena]|uniref:DUF6542 domain-containing protein n=1 Tax=Actinokineospora globicatena TaxID=103729 RepID=UPI0020A3AD92|nr:DUF6542 domain-containing protein [Actinokineospora globicatena]MCP2300529.1 hypothetical protein [Actinokineospora globicatena]GLW81072.1 hypothetical protein Aglo01_55530 [Actinokineospora globicatena]GLW88265.1 hypothetical protein Aglo02_59040 [Actinokineospora globicatena]